MRGARRGDIRQFLESAHSMQAQVQRFTEAADPSATPARESRLEVAMEELRAQNETLSEACSQLEQEIAKYRDLYDGSPDVLVTTDARGVILDANVATARLLGIAHELLPGKLLIGFVARRDTVPFRGRLRAIVEGAEHGTFSVRIRPRGASPILAHLAVRAVHGHVRAMNGRRDPPVALHWTIRTDPGRAPHEGDVYDLLGTAADELRAPITATAGWSRLLVDGALPEPEHAAAVAAIAESARAQKTLLDQMVELVALTRDSEPAAEVSLAEIVELAADRARPAAVSRSVLLEVERRNGDARTRARADHLVWALDRLLAQAILAASSPGTVHVRIIVDRARAALQVRATGAPALGGSRLAVAVASAAIERQGGQLRVPELAQDGVVFEVGLPIASPARDLR